ncbi:MAG: hypothetical protein V4525_07960 [Pseudomonadota bacterium]
MSGSYFDKQTPRWPSFYYNKIIYDLSHLNEYIFLVIDSSAVERKIAVTFSDHCFTSKNKDDNNSILYSYSSRKPGYFCFKRYSLSLGLKDHILNASEGEVWLVEGENLAIVPTVDVAGKEVLYGIIFNLKRIKGLPVDLHMRIETAYPCELKELTTFGSVRFKHFVTLRMQGKMPNRNLSKHRKKPKLKSKEGK